jgi:hypothetical protein
MEPAPDLPADRFCLAVTRSFELFERIRIFQQGIRSPVDPARDLRVAERPVAEFFNHLPAGPGSLFRKTGVRSAERTFEADT